MKRPVIIDCFPESAAAYRDDHAIVAVDVIRATTFAVTAVAAGRKCYAAENLEDAFELRRRLGDPLLAGELGGDMPDGFDMNNSPAELALRADTQRPLVMLSSSGTQLMLEAAKSMHGAFVASFRNFEAVARAAAGIHDRIAVIGAGSRHEFREEDQMCCAWVSEALLRYGYEPANEYTAGIIERWKGAPADACADGNSVAYLRRSNQLRDFDFILAHVNDLDLAVTLHGNEVCPAETAIPARAEAA